MKHGKRPTRRQKEKLKRHRLNSNNWLICKDSREVFEIVHRVTGTVRTYSNSCESEGGNEEV